MENRYEHHISIEQDKLCPFKLHRNQSYMNSGINWHKNIEILLVNEGKGMVKYGVKEFAVRENDIVIINSGTMHRVYSETGLDFFCLIISDKFFIENGIDINQYKFQERITDEDTRSKFREIVFHMSKKDGTDPMATALKRKAVLALIIDICTKHVADESGILTDQSTSEEYVKKALSYISDNFAESITLEEIADYVGISKYYMAREFKKYTGQTPFTYINTLRCKKADVCISEGMNVSEAARESGFETVSYFSRTYKKLMGVNPSKIKNNI